MSGDLSLWRRLATICLLPGIVLRAFATVTALAFVSEPDDLEDGLDAVLRADPWLLRTRSVVVWRRLDADWPLAPTAQTLIPVLVLGAVYPYHVQVTYPLTHPGAVPSPVLWIPMAYVAVNVLYAALADMAVMYLDAFVEARRRLGAMEDAS